MKISQSVHPKPLLVLVHPGSLCGSFQTAHDWHPKWSGYADLRRRQICVEFAFLDAHKVVVLGTQLDDEIVRYPVIQNAVTKAGRRYRAAPRDKDLRKIARQIWMEHSGNATSIRVTGAWADSKDGCAWTICSELRRLAGKTVSVRLSPLAARNDMRDCEIEAGPVHPLGNSPSKVRWHVSRYPAALEHNERLLNQHIRTNPGWRDLGERLKLIGGTTVCAAFEEDMELILGNGMTWVPLQREIILARGEGSRCHQNVLCLWEANPDLHVCTGYALSKDGIWRSHSWCFESSSHRIIETTKRRIAYHGAVLSQPEIHCRLSEFREF